MRSLVLFALVLYSSRASSTSTKPPDPTRSRQAWPFTNDNNAFTPNDEGPDRGFLNEPVLSERAWDTQSADYSHMTPTATSSSSPMISSMCPQNKVNKVSPTPTCPVPSFIPRQALEDSTHRHSTRHSHGNPIAASTPNQLALRNPNRVSRVSNEVYIDGPPPITPVVDYRYSSPAWDERSSDQHDMKKLLIDKDPSIKPEGQTHQMTNDMSAKECECENDKKSKDSMERAYKDTKREADNDADRLACCQRSNAQLRKKNEEYRALLEREYEEKIAVTRKYEKLKLSFDEATTRIETLQDEILPKSRRITELEAVNAELQKRLDASTNAKTRHSGAHVKQEANGFETLTEADSGDDLWVATSLRSDASRIPRSASSNPSLIASSYLPDHFETLIRSLYRKAMGIDSLASALTDVIDAILSGNSTEAGCILAAYSETKDEESEANESETPAKISIDNAERYLRKVNYMLDPAEKRLLESCDKLKPKSDDYDVVERLKKWATQFDEMLEKIVGSSLTYINLLLYLVSDMGPRWMRGTVLAVFGCYSFMVIVVKVFFLGGAVAVFESALTDCLTKAGYALTLLAIGYSQLRSNEEIFVVGSVPLALAVYTVVWWKGGLLCLVVSFCIYFAFTFSLYGVVLRRRERAIVLPHPQGQ